MTMPTLRAAAAAVVAAYDAAAPDWWPPEIDTLRDLLAADDAFDRACAKAAADLAVGLPDNVVPEPARDADMRRRLAAWFTPAGQLHDLDVTTAMARENRRMLAALAPCHPDCALGAADHPGTTGYRCLDASGATLPFPGEAYPGECDDRDPLDVV